MNVFSILFAVETLLLFIGYVDVTFMSMLFYAITILTGVVHWADNQKKPNVSKPRITKL